MRDTVFVKPELLRWAIKRSRLSVEDLARSFPKLDEWLSGERQPTHKQLEQFAQKTMAPFGYFFLDEPPKEELAIPDFRTMGNVAIDRPSPNLLETIQVMRRRQTWMRDYLIDEGEMPLTFVGEAKQIHNVDQLAARMRETLALKTGWSESLGNWEVALRTLRGAAENIGVLVSASGIVGLNTHRPLDPQEFRGFVLCDSYAPLIFVNSADSKSAQMFTFAHELVHLWIGEGGLFNLIDMMPNGNTTERFCNEVAAEFLVPADEIKRSWNVVSAAGEPFREIARRFKVSPVVAARRALDLGLISPATFFAFYRKDQEDWERKKAEEKAKNKDSGGGPNFYDVQDARLGRKFAYAVVSAAREGRLLFRNAYQLTDLKGETFDKYATLLSQRMKDEP